jgi:ATP-dependent DNA helicase RecQ
MTRLEAALEKENIRRSGDRSPESVRGMPIGVRRGRLMPRAEQADDTAPSSRNANFDALERFLAGAGVVADADVMRGYLNPWLNGGDVLAFVPADRAALIGAGSVGIASQKKVLIVLPTEENVVEQLNLLRGAGLDVKTLPHSAEERNLEARALSRASSLVLLMSLEQLLKEEVVDDVRKICVDLLAIDECQRVSELAPDFDPSVERMADLAPRIGRPPTLSLLRAVPPSVRSDLPHRLGLRNPLRVDLSPVHDGLSLDVITTDPNRRLGLLAEQLRMSQLPAVVLGYSMADVNDIHNALCQSGFDARRLDHVTGRPQATDTNSQTVWVMSTGRITAPLLYAHTLVHFRSPPSLEQYCRDLGWITHTSGHSRSLMLVTNDDESLVKGTLDRLRPRAEDLVGLASVLVRQGANATTVLLDSLCPAVGMNRARVEALIAIFARVGWVDHAQDWVRLRPDCTDLVDRARGLGARLKTAKERDAQRLRSVSAYVISRGCRQESLRRHFGTAGSRPCGLCDACRTGRVVQNVQSTPQSERLAEETPAPPSVSANATVSADEPSQVTPNTIFGERRPMRGRIIQIG